MSTALETARQAADRLGLRLITVENGIEAIERFRAERPRFVLIERLLPVADGVQVARRIRESVAGSRTVVIMTAAVFGSDAQAIRTRLQLTDVLEKPFTPQDIVRALAPFVERDDSVVAGSEPGDDAIESFDVAETPPARVLAGLLAQGRAGQLQWRDGELTRSLYLDGLSVLSASSNGRRDIWPAWAARDPLLDPATRGRLAAMAMPGPGDEGWARYLERRGAFTAEQYRASIERWLIDTAFDLIVATSGRLEFRDGVRSSEALGRVDARQLVFHGLRYADGASFEGLLPDPGDLLGATPKREAAGELELTPIEHQILALIDGQHSLGDLQSLARIVELDLRPFLYGCLALGLAKADESAAARSTELTSGLGENSLPATGSLADVHAGRVLSTISFGGATGILQLRRGEQMCSIDVQAGRIVFARSNQAKFRLGNVLLRAGKIAPEDHGRALAIHNAGQKHRLGYVLLEMGALSLKELHEGLCAQIRSIIGDGFSWTDGEYAFIEGRLPTSDAVSLDASMPNLILRLYRANTTRDVLVSYAPPTGARLVRLWDDARVARWLQPNPTDGAILAAANDDLDVGQMLGRVTGEPSDLLASIVALIGLGCLAAPVSADADRTPALEALARDKAASVSGATDLGAVADHLEADDVRHVLAHLEARVRALEAENLRLRALLAEKEQVAVG